MTYSDDLQMVKASLLETIKQTNGLAIGLQNAAPPQEAPPPSVKYLFETSELLQEKLNSVNQLIQEVSS